ncbi:MAG: sugar transferase [Conexibacter sp.]|nr:sugar transferase [Conexibacter sp.]
MASLAEQFADPRVEHSPPTAAYHRKLVRRRRLRAYRIADTAMLLLAISAAIVAAQGSASASDFLWGGLYVLLTLAVLEARGFYGERLHDATVDTVARIFTATTIAAMVLALTRAVLDGGDTLLGHQTLRVWAFALVFLAAGRIGITIDRRRALARGEIGANTLIIGAGSVGHLIAKRLRERPELGLRPVGFLDRDPMITSTQDNDGLPVLGASWDLERVVQDNDVEQAIVTFSTAPHPVLLNMIRRCRELGVQIIVVPRLFEEVNNRLEVEHVGGIPLLRQATVDPRGWQFSVKYALDRVIAAVAGIVFLPVLAGLALAVRLSSPGPILYRQRRVGLDGHEFDMLKFRTMRGDAEHSGEADARWAASMTGSTIGKVVPVQDRRTAVGRILRKLSLDELPQLLNVLRGEMSLVGPRPERTGYVAAFEQHIYRYGDRHRVKSGLTGWAQVQGLRGETSLSDRVEWDNYYIENWSLWLDLKILLMTLPALLGDGGATGEPSPEADQAR